MRCCAQYDMNESLSDFVPSCWDLPQSGTSSPLQLVHSTLSIVRSGNEFTRSMP